MMTIRPGEFWIADIPFSNGAASKKRPVLVLWLDGRDVAVAAETSAPPRTQRDVMLIDWGNEGLRLASTVRLSRLDCLEQFLLMARIGEITGADGARVKQIWAEQIKPQF